MFIEHFFFFVVFWDKATLSTAWSDCSTFTAKCRAAPHHRHWNPFKMGKVVMPNTSAHWSKFPLISLSGESYSSPIIPSVIKDCWGPNTFMSRLRFQYINGTFGYRKQTLAGMQRWSFCLFQYQEKPTKTPSSVCSQLPLDNPFYFLFVGLQLYIYIFSSKGMLT